MPYGGFGFAPGPISVVTPGGTVLPGGVTFQPPPPGSTSLDPFGPGIPDIGDTVAQGAFDIACGVSAPIFCNHPIGRGLYESVCGSCDTPFVDPVNGGVQPFAPGNGGGVVASTPSSGCVPCGKNECKVPYIVKSGPCKGQTRHRKGRLVEDPRTGQTMCVPKSRKKFNLSNGKANARSRSRFTAVLKDAHKSIDAAREAVKKPATCK